MRKFLLSFLLSNVFINGFACTTFASFNGESNSFVMAKNRDNRPDSQLLEVVAEKNKYKYLALSRQDAPDFVSAGVNEYNLSVFNEVTIEYSKFAVGGIADDFSKDILQNYRDVLSVIPDLDKLVQKYPDPVFYQVSDGKILLAIEVGNNHQYRYKLIKQSDFVHTNNYLESSLISNYKYDHQEQIRKNASLKRLYRANFLISQESSLSLVNMQRIGYDHNAGVNDSIYRIGEVNQRSSVRSLAFFGVQIMNNKTAKILVKFYTNGNNYSYVLNSEFWQKYNERYNILSPLN